MKIVIGLNTISEQGNIRPRKGLYTQLRLKSDGVTVVCTGQALGGEVGKYEFDIPNQYLTSYLALYVTTQNGGIYTEEISWGGTDGIRQKEYLSYNSQISAASGVMQSIAINELATVSSIGYGLGNTTIRIVFTSNVFLTQNKVYTSVDEVNGADGLKNVNFNFSAIDDTLIIYGVNPEDGTALSFETLEVVFKLQIKIYL